MSGRARLRGGRKAALVLLVFASVGFGASTALAQTVSVSTTTLPLPGSQFQGGDGDLANASGLIDWQGLQADGVVGHTSDPQASDNIFAGGSKELEPDGWGLTTAAGGASPGSGNVLDVYRAVDRPVGGDVFLYLAFTREASNGTIFVTFELSQVARRWRNSKGANIPCRTTGDILISFDDHGNTAEVQIDRWVTDAAASNGCAKTGHLVSAANLKPNVDVQAAFNYSSAINNYLPGFYAASIPELRFGEAAINLSTVLAELGHRCAAFGSTWMHSRASLSDTAAMKDYVAPRPFPVRTCKASPDLTSAASGKLNPRARGKQGLRRYRALRATAALSDTARLSGGDDPTGTLTFALYGPHDRSCTRTPAFTSTSGVIGNGYYRSGSFTPSQAGTYRWVITYSGDNNNQPAGPTGCGEGTETVVVSRARPTLTSSASGPLRRFVRPARHAPHRLRAVRVHAARAAQRVHDTANLAGGSAPTGTITFSLYGPDDADCSGDAIFTSSVPVDGNGSYNSAEFAVHQAGTYRWVVTYSGDPNNKQARPTECGIDSETVVISPAQPTISTVASGSVDLGNPISDTATLTGGAHPTGTITFHVYGPRELTCTGRPLQSSTASVTGNGTYRSQPFTPVLAGTYRWFATYSGDDNNAAAGPTACRDPAEAAVVAHPVARPDIRSTASASAPAGAQIHDTAHLSGGDTPAGTITFSVYGPDDATCSAPPAGMSTMTVSGNGDYTSRPFTPTAAGTYRWIVEYSGDDRNLPAGPTDCADADESVVVSQAAPALRTLALGLAPIGGQVRDRALLSGGSQPRGVVTVQWYGPNDPACSAPPVFTTRQTVLGKGFYQSSKFTPGDAGTYLWVARYSGDPNNEPAATSCGDAAERALVLRRQPFLTSSASPPANVGKSPRVSPAGLKIYDAATLHAGLKPTGSITFSLFGPDDPTCSAAPIFTSSTQVSGDGAYNSERFTPTASGTYRWTATYSGDTNNHAAGPTRCGVKFEQVSVTVPASPQLRTSASGAVTLGGAIYDTAHLSGGSTPTGTLTFRLYGPADPGCSGHPLFTSTVRVAGNHDYRSQSFVPLAAGQYRWVADYSGDAANKRAGPTACGEIAENAIVRPPDIIPVTPTFSTTAARQPPGSRSLYDIAHLAGGIAPGGTITFALFGPDDLTCSGPPAFTATTTVTGNGEYRSTAFTVPTKGTYLWVATYSGDAMNATAGPTACGDPAETTSVSATPSPAPDPGPNVKGLAELRPKPKPIPPPPPPAPIVTG